MRDSPLRHRVTEKSNKVKRTVDMAICQSRSYIESNPKFALTRPTRPKTQEGQMKIVYMRLEPSASIHSLEDLVRECARREYKATFQRSEYRHSQVNLVPLKPPGTVRIDY
jgi:hypothetical protein